MANSKFPAIDEAKLETYLELDFDDATLQKLNDKAKENYDKEIKRFTLDTLGPSCHAMKELRLVLLGKTGAGKSATGNLILGGSRFQESAGSVSCTGGIQEEHTEIDGIKVRIIDTPGLFDTSADQNTTLTKIAQFIDTFSDGVHGFLLVNNLGNCRFTEEEREVFADIDQAFARKDKTSEGPSFTDHSFIILTHGKDMVKHVEPNTETRQKATEPSSLTEKLESETDTPFGKLLINDMKKKVIVVENGQENGYFREELRKQVVRLITSNILEPYTNEVFLKFLKDQNDVAAEMDPVVQAKSAEIENEVSKHMHVLSHEGIKDMPENEKMKVVGETLEKLGSKWGNDIPKESLEKATKSVVEAKKKRLTSEDFLDSLERFGKGLLKVINVGFKIAVTVVQIVKHFKK